MVFIEIIIKIKAYDPIIMNVTREIEFVWVKLLYKFLLPQQQYHDL